MELRQLLCVEAVVRHRHFTRAATELHLAQSALSHQIRRLERELGTPLFERTSRRVAPTDAGLLLAARARRVLAEVAAARHEVDELRGVLRGNLRIGPLWPSGDVDVPGVLARFGRAHPGVRLTLHEGVAADLLQLVATDELDAVFCLLARGAPDGLATIPLGHEEVVIAYPPGQAPDTPAVDVAALADVALVGMRPGSAISTLLHDRFVAAGRTLQLVCESGDPLLLRALAARGFAAAVLPRSVTDLPGPPVQVRPLAPRARLPVALVWRDGRPASPAARRFVEFVRALR